MIRYPLLEKDATIGVTAPSSGVPKELHTKLKSAFTRMESKGYKMSSGDTPWTHDMAKSAPAIKRAEEFQQMMRNETIQLIFPPWGGELLIEVLEYIDFDQIQNKWVLGYSDISLLLLAITLKTGVATAHGTNLFDMRAERSDETTDKWQTVLSTKLDESILQHSSRLYQKEWEWEPKNPSPQLFNLTEKTEWKSVNGEEASINGRLLGGCIDIIRHLIGTPYGDVGYFKKHYINEEPVIWYLENCELSVTDLRRSLVHMKLVGWFDNCSGILFGRSEANNPVGNYTVEDVYHELSEELQIPVIYDIDCGHQPPQITFVNGAYAEVKLKNGRGTVLQTFKQ